jgi:anti-anti-sigma regulatory factor
VERITSSGVGILCACFTSLLAAGGGLHLAGVNLE